MEINTASVSGYLRFYRARQAARAAAARPIAISEEQRAIEAWLRLIAQAAPLSAELALEIAECARLIKGYGDTHKRGSGNYRLIERELILPALAGAMPPRQAADAIANARTAALLDPEGEALAKCLAEIQSRSNQKTSRPNKSGRGRCESGSPERPRGRAKWQGVAAVHSSRWRVF